MTGERLRSSHEAELGQILRDARIARTLFPTDGPPDATQVRAILARHVAHWDERGFGLWLLRNRVGGAVVGRGGLLSQTIEGRAEVEVGWAILPELWGQGLATELARASIGIAFAQLGLEELISFTLTTNGASRRVMEKAGFTYERDFDHISLPHALYRLRRTT
jgi:RimJ/RimL family protein N-acetyltransferase